MIFLRALEPEDLELLYTIENDPDLWAVSNNEAPYSRYSLKEYIASQPNSLAESHCLRLIACRTDNQKAIGIVDLSDYSPIHQRAEIGIALLKDEQQKGFGKAILRELEKIAVQKFNIRQVYAYTYANNEAAGRKLFISSNYNEVGVIKGWHYDGNGFSDVIFFQNFLQEYI